MKIHVQTTRILTKRLCGMTLLAALFVLAGCEKLGLEDPAKIAERVENEGKAVGGACRHTGRSIEDCYALNPRASKAAVFNGWREMNDYMVQNKMETMPSTIADAVVKEKTSTAAHDAKTDDHSDKSKSQEKIDKSVKDSKPTKEFNEIKEVKDAKQAKEVLKEVKKDAAKDGAPVPTNKH